INCLSTHQRPGRTARPADFHAIEIGRGVDGSRRTLSEARPCPGSRLATGPTAGFARRPTSRARFTGRAAEFVERISVEMGLATQDSDPGHRRFRNGRRFTNSEAELAI